MIVGLIAAVALASSFSAHFEREYTYTTPIGWVDLVKILARFTPVDLLQLPYVLLFTMLAVTTVVALYTPGTAPLRIGLSLPQLVLLPLLPMAIDVSSFNQQLFLAGKQDGEWLHEGWPIFEAGGLWVTVPLLVVIGELAMWSRRRASASRIAANA